MGLKTDSESSLQVSLFSAQWTNTDHSASVGVLFSLYGWFQTLWHASNLDFEVADPRKQLLQLWFKLWSFQIMHRRILARQFLDIVAHIDYLVWRRFFSVWVTKHPCLAPTRHNKVALSMRLKRESTWATSRVQWLYAFTRGKNPVLSVATGGCLSPI